jgi:hypothetical protein
MLVYPCSPPFMASSSMPLCGFRRILAPCPRQDIRLNTERCGQMMFLVTTIDLDIAKAVDIGAFAGELP